MYGLMGTAKSPGLNPKMKLGSGLVSCRNLVSFLNLKKVGKKRGGTVDIMDYTDFGCSERRNIDMSVLQLLPGSSEITLSYENQGLTSDDDASLSANTSFENGSGYGTYISAGNSEITSESSRESSSESEFGKKSKTSSGSAGYGSALVTIDQDIADLSTAYHNPYYIYSDIPCSPPGSPYSERSFGHGTKSFNGSVRSKHSSGHAYTRQLNVFIGEEWEDVQDNNFHLNLERRAISCPPSPHISRFPILKQPRMLGKPANISRELSQSRRAKFSHDSLRDFFFHLSQEEHAVVSNDYTLKPNPYNNINHKIHSALHCPCFLFFFFLCCLPGVHYMQEGDVEYKTGNEDRARVLGRRSTVLYCIGIVVGIVLLSAAVVVAVHFVQGQVDEPRMS